MAQEFAKGFYNSTKWRKCRKAFIASNLYICNRCKGYGDIVHHKQEITRENINNHDVTLSWGNLECLCHDCHNLEHNPQEIKATADGLYFDDAGNLIKA